MPIDFIHESDFGTSFFEDIKSELGLKSSKAVACVVKKILSGVQNLVSAPEPKTSMVIPDNFEKLSLDERKQNQPHLSYDHLDQWVETISKEDSTSSNRIFYSEIDILKALVITIKKLDKACGLLSFPGFKFSLVQEIKQASL